MAILVEYGNQLKSIYLLKNDDLISIESKIYERFQFNIEQKQILQLQWYDTDFSRYIDLDVETWLKFSTFLHNNGVESQRPLKLVQKQSIERTNSTMG